MSTKTANKEPELFAPEKPAAAPKKPVKTKGHAAPPKEAPATDLPATQSAVEPPARTEPTTLYSAIIQAARDPAVDAEKMKSLVDLQISIEKWEAEKAFTRAFNALQSELPTIDKDGLIDHGEGRTARGNEKLKSRFSTYPNLMGVCRPLLKKHGFTFNNVIEPTPDGARIVVVGYLTHVDGHQTCSRFPLGADAGPGRSNAQAWGSATSYGKRYNLILMLDIVSEAPQDQDDDGRKKKPAAVEAISPAQVEEIRIALEDAGLDPEVFCEKYEIKAVADLPPKRFAEAKKALADYKARKQALERGDAKAG